MTEKQRPACRGEGAMHMLTTRTKIETRYPDCDRMGVVHHAVYPVWYELARMDWLNAAGLDFLTMQPLGVNPAMVDLHIRYLAAASYPQTLYIETRPSLVAPKKLELQYTVTDEEGKPVSDAVTFHIWTGPDNRSYDLEKHQPELYRLLQAAAAE